MITNPVLCDIYQTAARALRNPNKPIGYETMPLTVAVIVADYYRDSVAAATSILLGIGIDDVRVGRPTYMDSEQTLPADRDVMTIRMTGDQAITLVAALEEMGGIPS
jgi:hypothetical protein